jgi:hypothetical protein
MAQGREVRLSISDSLATGISASLHDAWIATSTASEGLPMVDRTLLRTDTLAQVRTLFRTAYFRATDSTEIGLKLAGTFIGDSGVAAGASARFVAELVDSASGDVVHVLDSFAISSSVRSHIRRIDTLFDLLLGTYAIRLRIDTTGFVPPTSTYNARYPVAELSEYVGSAPLSKLVRREGPAGPVARISAHPNPFNAGTEIYFSIPRREKVTMTLYDRTGVTVTTLAENEWMDEGRYSIGLDGSELQPGTYLVELRYGSDRIVEKVVIVR